MVPVKFVEVVVVVVMFQAVVVVALVLFQVFVVVVVLFLQVVGWAMVCQTR